MSQRTDLLNFADLDINTLPETQAMQAYPFWQAYHREYPPALTWRQLRQEGLLPIEHETVSLADIEEGFDELIQWTLDEDGCVVPLSGEERRDWVSRKINSWTRRREWSTR